MNPDLMNPRLTYRESAVAGASPVRQVILLYEQAIEDLRRALVACRANDIEARTRQINHAILILGCLQSALDRERGGKVAAHLNLFYNEVRAGLVGAQCGQSPAAIERQIALLVEVHEAWCEVERCEVEKRESGRSEVERLEAQRRVGGHEQAAPSPEKAPANGYGSALEQIIDRPTPMPAEGAARSSAEWNA